MSSLTSRRSPSPSPVAEMAKRWSPALVEMAEEPEEGDETDSDDDGEVNGGSGDSKTPPRDSDSDSDDKELTPLEQTIKKLNTMLPDFIGRITGRAGSVGRIFPMNATGDQAGRASPSAAQQPSPSASPAEAEAEGSSSDSEGDD